jgi:hypothetical protein
LVVVGGFVVAPQVPLCLIFTPAIVAKHEFG